jgi:hypothetical protein
MKYRVHYSDEPGSEEIVEAADHREAARIFFEKKPKLENCQITVETTGWWVYAIQQFHISEFLDAESKEEIKGTSKGEVELSYTSTTGDAQDLKDTPQVEVSPLKKTIAYTLRIIAFGLFGLYFVRPIRIYSG